MNARKRKKEEDEKRRDDGVDDENAILFTQGNRLKDVRERN